LKILKKLFSKSFLSGCRAEPCEYLCVWEKEAKNWEFLIPNFWLVFSAKKIKKLV